MERITREQLEVQLKATAKAMGRSVMKWEQGDDGLRCEQGSLHLDHYNGWDVVEMSNEFGGERSLIGKRRLKADAMLACLRGMEEAAQISANIGSSLRGVKKEGEDA